MPRKQYVWLDGKLVDFKDANVHVLTHSLQYGSGIFEGIRAYKTDKGTAIFRLDEHIKRFLNTARIHSVNIGLGESTLKKAVVDLVRKNGLESCYIRPFAFYNNSEIGLDVTGKKISVAIAAVPFGKYFSDRDKGIKCKVSSWQRINSSILPPQAKASGNYINSILASKEAKSNGADEAIMLTSNGYVAEGAGENIFLVNNSKLITPSASADILMGITRDSVIKIAESIGIIVEERNVHREELYTCDEIFFTGTAAEVTPIINVDDRKVGAAHIGPITKTISDFFFDVVQGRKDEFGNWLTYV